MCSATHSIRHSQMLSSRKTLLAANRTSSELELPHLYWTITAKCPIYFLGFIFTLFMLDARSILFLTPSRRDSDLTTVTKGGNIAWNVCATGEFIHLLDAQASTLLAPLSTIGVIQVVNKMGYLTDEDVFLLQLFASLRSLMLVAMLQRSPFSLLIQLLSWRFYSYGRWDTTTLFTLYVLTILGFVKRNIRRVFTAGIAGSSGVLLWFFTNTKPLKGNHIIVFVGLITSLLCLTLMIQLSLIHAPPCSCIGNQSKVPAQKPQNDMPVWMIRNRRIHLFCKCVLLCKPPYPSKSCGMKRP
ncbi:hypothetical protein Pelo_16631 [Pelomyxa schiedti]|nr:hypothetical protein Pelo_16631 [Pelomyxa schiedti]